MWLVSELDSGVPLRRFLQVVRLSPAQAAVIVMDVLTALHWLHDAGRFHTGLHADNVHIGPTGEARIGDWALAALVPHESSDEPRRADLAAVAAVAGQIAGAARPSPWPGDHRDAHLLHALEQAASNDALADAGTGAVAAALETGVGPGRQAVVRKELGALVAATPRSGKGPLVRSAVAGDAAQPTTGEAESTHRLRPSRAVRVTSKGVWRLLAALVVLGGLVGIEFAVLHGRITHDLRVLVGNQPASRGRPPSSATHSPGPVPALAPPASGPIAGVDIRPLHPCTAGSVCTIRVLVQLVPSHQPLRVEWTFDIVDRCTGAVVTQPGGAALAQPGNDTIVALSSPTLPLGRSIAVIAETLLPRAASAPLPVPAKGGSC
jgi:hypothetical protein